MEAWGPIHPGAGARVLRLSPSRKKGRVLRRAIRYPLTVRPVRPVRPRDLPRRERLRTRSLYRNHVDSSWPTVVTTLTPTITILSISQVLANS
jgi:hypothetical protein